MGSVAKPTLMSTAPILSRHKSALSQDSNTSAATSSSSAPSTPSKKVRFNWPKMSAKVEDDGWDFKDEPRRSLIEDALVPVMHAPKQALPAQPQPLAPAHRWAQKAPGASMMDALNAYVSVRENLDTPPSHAGRRDKVKRMQQAIPPVPPLPAQYRKTMDRI